ncbi:MAG: DUF5676 family membrane protein [Proteobacteria bacterium]|nr:DUF5676 family membrane protein [Pseudomonadota bacterium]
MQHKISLFAFGQASSLFLAITFTFCVAFGLVFPQYAMYGIWEKLLPGFEWLSWQGFLIGLIESYAYGWYFALIWVPLYNFFGRKSK